MDNPIERVVRVLLIAIWEVPLGESPQNPIEKSYWLNPIVNPIALVLELLLTVYWKPIEWLLLSLPLNEYWKLIEKSDWMRVLLRILLNEYWKSYPQFIESPTEWILLKAPLNEYWESYRLRSTQLQNAHTSRSDVMIQQQPCTQCHNSVPLWTP